MRVRAALTIFGQVLLVCVTYGIIHDQITARLCPEYFTIGHPTLGLPQIYHSPNPTVLGLAWGITATWWMALLLSPPLVAAALLGPLPPLAPRDLRKPIGVVMMWLFLTAFAAGLYGHIQGSAQLDTFFSLFPQDPELSHLPKTTQLWFYVDAWSHSASYLGGAVGALALCTWANRRRRHAPASTHS